MLWCRVPLLLAVGPGAPQSRAPLFPLASNPPRTGSRVSPGLGSISHGRLCCSLQRLLIVFV